MSDIDKAVLTAEAVWHFCPQSTCYNAVVCWPYRPTALMSLSVNIGIFEIQNHLTLRIKNFCSLESHRESSE